MEQNKRVSLRHGGQLFLGGGQAKAEVIESRKLIMYGLENTQKILYKKVFNVLSQPSGISLLTSLAIFAFDPYSISHFIRGSCATIRLPE